MEIKNELILQPVPEVGKVYHAFDDGKIRPTRHMLVRVDDVIPNAHMKPWMKAVVYYESLKHDWLFNGYTDYVVKCTWKVAAALIQGKKRDFGRLFSKMAKKSAAKILIIVNIINPIIK